MSGYEKLKEAVTRDCNGSGPNEHCGCFNPDGCNVEGHRIGEYGKPGYKSCFHRYCDKFKWVIDRAKHYEEKTCIPWEQILDSWESRRNYWYMNYYQECNQPEIKSDRVRVFDTLEDLKASIGDKGFRCPSCGKISKSPYECTSEGCDWKVYGLFKDLGKSVFVFVKEKIAGETIFMPIAWEAES